MDDRGPDVYVTEALIRAEFNEMSSEEFENSFLAPLDRAIEINKITFKPLLDGYLYPFDDTKHSELRIQTYFYEDIARPLKKVYRNFYGNQSQFGQPSMVRTPFYRQTRILPDIAHFFSYSPAGDFDSPKFCFALGGYKKGNYRLGEGFENLIKIIRDYNLNGQSQFSLEEKDQLFRYKQWSSDVVFAMVLRKYLLGDSLCETDRVFISDHQSFSGFFQYEHWRSNEN